MCIFLFLRCSVYTTYDCKLMHVLRVLLLQAVQLTKFDYRLANELDDDLQKLRCHVNFHALRFTNSIQSLGQKLVQAMRKMSSRYIAIHLRYVLSCYGLAALYLNN